MKKQGYVLDVVCLCQIIGGSKKLGKKNEEMSVTQLRMKYC